MVACAAQASLRQRQRVHVIERRRDQIAMALEVRRQAASPPPRYGSGARARRPSACRSSPTCRGTSPARRARGMTASNGPGSRNASNAGAERHATRKSAGQSAGRGASQNTSLAPASRMMKCDGLARKLEVHRHRHETRAHDAVIGREIFGAVGGQGCATRSPRASRAPASARATPFAMASSCAKLNSRGACSPPRSMIAIFDRSRSRGIRSPRLVNGGIMIERINHMSRAAYNRAAVISSSCKYG